MSDRHLAHWPTALPLHLTVPETNLYYNVEVAARRYPDKPFLVFYDTQIGYAEFRDECERLAGYLQQECGVKRGDRVLLYMQNSPQFVIGYYAILRAGAVVVPVNPMNLTDELQHYVDDAGATTALVPQDLYRHVAPPLQRGLRHLVVACYADYLKVPTELPLPEFVKAPRQPVTDAGAVAWSEALARDLRPRPLDTGPEDLCVMPYTSGTTGHPKGCMHTHRSTMFNAVSSMTWFSTSPDSVFLATLPLFHVTGMEGCMNGPLYLGATVVLLPRWDREAALRCVERYRISNLSLIAAMVVDMLSHPKVTEFDLSSLRRISGGGAAMPDAVAQRMKDLLGLDYVEGYGMSETIAPTHINPPQRPKKQCLGIPIFGVDARVVDPNDFRELPPGEVGEIVVNGTQVMQGYWGKPDATRASFVEIDGKPFLRTGDLARTDEDGYFFMVDRLKRMINASGFKVWPAEVEALLYRHPAIQEACVIAAKDDKRGETVKAIVVLREAQRGQVTEQQLVEWAHENMAAYKAPRIVQFADSLPKSGTGKVQWRALQDAENATRNA
ncbi:long-chain fatty acid--CoA ligase [Caldimonas tepidiphila]|uniref:long-chain fatty acid--CoA ligase n=1 Tax=Caldimonas tepidiphila TaxID=2315841 RepID=UPI000E5C4D13|nr:long-chain fatty acid--CoA ligase [Caldimonas tepidiphila]